MKRILTLLLLLLCLTTRAASPSWQEVTNLIQFLSLAGTNAVIYTNAAGQLVINGQPGGSGGSGTFDYNALSNQPPIGTFLSSYGGSISTYNNFEYWSNSLGCFAGTSISHQLTVSNWGGGLFVFSRGAPGASFLTNSSGTTGYAGYYTNGAGAYVNVSQATLLSSNPFVNISLATAGQTNSQVLITNASIGLSPWGYTDSPYSGDIYWNLNANPISPVNPFAKIQATWDWGGSSNVSMMLITSGNVRLEEGFDVSPGGLDNPNNNNFVMLGNEQFAGQIIINWSPTPATNYAGSSHPLGFYAKNFDTNGSASAVTPGIMGWSTGDTNTPYGLSGSYYGRGELWFYTAVPTPYNANTNSSVDWGDYTNYPGVVVMKMHTNSLEVLGTVQADTMSSGTAVSAVGATATGVLTTNLMVGLNFSIQVSDGLTVGSTNTLYFTNGICVRKTTP